MSRISLDETLISATGTNGTIGYVSSPLNGERITIYVETSAGVTAGTVLIEEAHDRAYAGTWSTVTSVSTIAASSVYVVHASGFFGSLRVRMSTATTGGTITVRAIVGGA